MAEESSLMPPSMLSIEFTSGSFVSTVRITRDLPPAVVLADFVAMACQKPIEMVAKLAFVVQNTMRAGTVRQVETREGFLSVVDAPYIGQIRKLLPADVQHSLHERGDEMALYNAIFDHEAVRKMNKDNDTDCATDCVEQASNDIVEQADNDIVEQADNVEQVGMEERGRQARGAGNEQEGQEWLQQDEEQKDDDDDEDEDEDDSRVEQAGTSSHGKRRSRRTQSSSGAKRLDAKPRGSDDQEEPAINTSQGGDDDDDDDGKYFAPAETSHREHGDATDSNAADGPQLDELQGLESIEFKTEHQKLDASVPATAHDASHQPNEVQSELSSLNAVPKLDSEDSALLLEWQAAVQLQLQQPPPGNILQPQEQVAGRRSPPLSHLSLLNSSGDSADPLPANAAIGRSDSIVDHKRKTMNVSNMLAAPSDSPRNVSNQRSIPSPGEIPPFAEALGVQQTAPSQNQWPLVPGSASNMSVHTDNASDSHMMWVTSNTHDSYNNSQADLSAEVALRASVGGGGGEAVHTPLMLSLYRELYDDDMMTAQTDAQHRNFSAVDDSRYPLAVHRGASAAATATFAAQNSAGGMEGPTTIEHISQSGSNWPPALPAADYQAPMVPLNGGTESGPPESAGGGPAPTAGMIISEQGVPTDEPVYLQTHSASFPTRETLNIQMQSMKRACSYCHVKGHNVRTCDKKRADGMVAAAERVSHASLGAQFYDARFAALQNHS